MDLVSERDAKKYFLIITSALSTGKFRIGVYSRSKNPAHGSKYGLYIGETPTMKQGNLCYDGLSAVKYGLGYNCIP